MGSHRQSMVVLTTMHTGAASPPARSQMGKVADEGSAKTARDVRRRLSIRAAPCIIPA